MCGWRHLEYARRSRSENGRWLSHLPFLTRAGRSLQKAAKRESEFRNAVACRVKDSANWKSEACPESGYVSRTALGTFALNQYEFRDGNHFIVDTIENESRLADVLQLREPLAAKLLPLLKRPDWGAATSGPDGAA